MILRFKKGREGKPSAFACIRADGSATYQAPLALPVQHDLLHYAVETTMNWRNAFLGMVASGRDMDSFGTKNGITDTYTQEEIWAETTVGLLQWPALSQGGVWTDEDLLALSQQSSAEQGIPAPPLTLPLLHEMRERAAALFRQWDDLPEGETMELVFPEA